MDFDVNAHQFISRYTAAAKHSTAACPALVQATFLSSYIHTVYIYVVLCLFSVMVYATSPDLGSPSKVCCSCFHSTLNLGEIQCACITYRPFCRVGRFGAYEEISKISWIRDQKWRRSSPISAFPPEHLDEVMADERFEDARSAADQPCAEPMHHALCTPAPRCGRTWQRWPRSTRWRATLMVR